MASWFMRIAFMRHLLLFNLYLGDGMPLVDVGNSSSGIDGDDGDELGVSVEGGQWATQWGAEAWGLQSRASHGSSDGTDVPIATNTYEA